MKFKLRAYNGRRAAVAEIKKRGGSRVVIHDWIDDRTVTAKHCKGDGRVGTLRTFAEKRFETRAAAVSWAQTIE